jgi:hypothetical protein
MAFPARTMRAMPPDGIVIVAYLPLPSRTPAPPHNVNFPDRRLPLKLSDARVNVLWESEPARNIPQYKINARVGRWYVEVNVYFATRHPDTTTLATAQAELDRLIVPAFPPGPSPASTWITNHIGSLTIETPPGWTFQANPVPRLVGPKIWFAIGTWHFPVGGDCGPVPALKELPRDGALFCLSETFNAGFGRGAFPRQPARFTLRGLKPLRNECSGTVARTSCSPVARSFLPGADRVRTGRVAGASSRGAGVHLQLSGGLRGWVAAPF